MSERPLLVFDFDGVIVDGMEEYWWSASTAAQQLLAPGNPACSADVAIPDQFRQLRPWIHHGWEMVLLAALLREPESSLQRMGVAAFVAAYAEHCQQALERRGWSPSQLQGALEQVRRAAVQGNRAQWLARHQAFAGVSERLRRFSDEQVDWAVLTTKGRAFTAELLDGLSLDPVLLFGHEDGTKPEVLLRLQQERALIGFVEDRRPTLETVLATPGLEALPCYLADWGYLRASDREALPEGIALLTLDQFPAPLADWP